MSFRAGGACGTPWRLLGGIWKKRSGSQVQILGISPSGVSEAGKKTQERQVSYEKGQGQNTGIICIYEAGERRRMWEGTVERERLQRKEGNRARDMWGRPMRRSFWKQSGEDSESQHSQVRRCLKGPPGNPEAGALGQGNWCL